MWHWPYKHEDTCLEPQDPPESLGVEATCICNPSGGESRDGGRHISGSLLTSQSTYLARETCAALFTHMHTLHPHFFSRKREVTSCRIIVSCSIKSSTSDQGCSSVTEVLPNMHKTPGDRGFTYRAQGSGFGPQYYIKIKNKETKSKLS